MSHANPQTYSTDWSCSAPRLGADHPGGAAFGGKVVAIPAKKFANAGQSIRLAMTTAEVGKLPAVDEKRG